jgi:hypothetical protein
MSTVGSPSAEIIASEAYSLLDTESRTYALSKYSRLTINPYRVAKFSCLSRSELLDHRRTSSSRLSGGREEVVDVSGILLASLVHGSSIWITGVRSDRLGTWVECSLSSGTSHGEYVWMYRCNKRTRVSKRISRHPRSD